MQNKKLNDIVQKIDYGCFLKIAAALPAPIGACLSYWRGLWQFVFDYDWRSMALGRNYIRKNVNNAMKELISNRLRSIPATAGRFLHNSRTEWQDSLFKYPDVIGMLYRKSQIDGIKELLDIQKQGRGIVLLSAHYDSFIMGMALLGMSGLRTNVLTSNVVQDPRIHPDVIKFFAEKYLLMEKYTNGKMAPYENGLDFYDQALNRGESVVIMADVQGNKSSIYIPFLNRRFRLPIGAWRMAQKTNSLIGAYMCSYIFPDVYHIQMLPPREIDPESPKNTLIPIYAFIEKTIRKHPERWLASEHLMNYDKSQAIQ